MPPSLTGSRAKLSSNAQTSFAQRRRREGQRLERPNDALKHGANMCLASRSHPSASRKFGYLRTIGRVCRGSLSRRGLRYPHTELWRAIDAVHGVGVEQTTLGSPMSLKRQGIEPRDPACLDDR